jgi:hypothetical protein
VVQVDVLWSYGIGASLGVSAARQVAARGGLPAQAPAEVGGGPGPGSRWADPYLIKTLLFLALVFAPSGVYLLWNFTSWETMHAAGKDLPAWLVCLFGLTNVTQGLLGYWVVQRLWRAGRRYLAYLQVVLGYFGMFFILVYGWDGSGYRRFFSPTHHDFVNWHGHWLGWFGSDVALTLLAMGVLLVPLLVGLQVSWLRGGYRLAGVANAPGPLSLAMLCLAPVFVAGLGLAVACAVILISVGPLAGLPLALVVLVAALVPRGPVHLLFRGYMQTDGTAEPALARRPALPVGAS